MTPRHDLEGAPNATADVRRHPGERKVWIPPHVKPFPITTMTQGGSGAASGDDVFYRAS